MSAITPLTEAEVDERGLYPRTYHAAVFPLPLAKLSGRYGLEVYHYEDEGLGPVQVVVAERDGIAFAANEYAHSPNGDETLITVGPDGMSSAFITGLTAALASELGTEPSWQTPDEVFEQV